MKPPAQFLLEFVVVDGRDTAHHPPRELADVVGVVPQDPMSGFVTDTVEDELAYGMECLGIAPDVMARLFEPFFTTRPVGEGTGLGLPVVHGIIESLRGTISVESTPGVGSTFIVRFPLTDDTAAAVPQQHGAEK